MCNLALARVFVLLAIVEIVEATEENMVVAFESADLLRMKI